jgi:hypothetical protein
MYPRKIQCTIQQESFSQELQGYETRGNPRKVAPRNIGTCARNTGVHMLIPVCRQTPFANGESPYGNFWAKLPYAIGESLYANGNSPYVYWDDFF